MREVFEFRHSLSEETDRGCALMAAAYLADQLERLLRRTFVDDETAIEELFRPLGPLGSFSGRIEMCYALGLLSDETRRDLNLIRKIRNDFGHVAKTLTFDEPGIDARCRELHHSYREAESPARSKFTSAVMAISGVVHALIHMVRQPDVAGDVMRTEEMKRNVRELAEKWAATTIEELGLAEVPRPEKSDT